MAISLSGAATPSLLFLVAFFFSAEYQKMMLMCLGDTQLHPVDLAVLKDVRSSLSDLPGSSFFATWDFDDEQPHDPCSSFSGVVCEQDFLAGETRISSLDLGASYAGSPGLMGRLSPSLGNLTFLKQLSLSPGRVSGDIPASLGNLTRLQFMGMSNNLLTESIPASFSRLINLRVLDLSNNVLTGSIPNQLGSLPGLLAITLSNNKLTGPVPKFTGPMLQHIHMATNALSGELATFAHFPSSLRFLSLHHNNLTGLLHPNTLASLQNLDYLDLSFNSFTGNFPVELLKLQMSALLLQRNELSGEVQPSEPVRIRTVDLSHNRFSGKLSPFFASAQSLYANNNNFSGVVPPELVESLVGGTMQVLYLQHNYLTGFHIDPLRVLPPAASVCIQYNCMMPPIQSACPANTGKSVSRPLQQCRLYGLTFHQSTKNN